MPIEFKKQAFTLQEKIDKAIALTYQIKDVADAEFMRGFLLTLIEKAFLKVSQDVEKVDGVFYQKEIKHPDKDLVNKIDEIKREIQ